MLSQSALLRTMIWRARLSGPGYDTSYGNCFPGPGCVMDLWSKCYFLGSFVIGAPLPLWFSDPRLSDWKNYMVMPLIFLIAVNAITTKKQMQTLLVLMCLSVILLDRSFVNLMSGRDMSSFSYDMRDAGAMG